MMAEVETMQDDVVAEVPQAEAAKAKALAEFRDIPQEAAKGLAFEKTFEMTFKDADGAVVYHGRFTCKRMTLGGLSRMGVLKARRNGGESVPSMVDFLNEMMSYLDVTLVSFPEWWKPEEFYDADVLREVYDHVRSWEACFSRRVAS